MVISQKDEPQKPPMERWGRVLDQAAVYACSAEQGLVRNLGVWDRHCALFVPARDYFMLVSSILVNR